MSRQSVHARSVHRLLGRVFVVLLGSVILTLLHGQTASAAVTNAPDPNFYTPNGSDVLLVASKAGTNSGGTYNALESPVIVVMAYFDNPTGNSITVWNGDSPCGIPGNGTGVDGTVEGPTAFAFLDVAANSYTNIVGSGSMGCGNYTVNLPTLQPYTIPGSGGQQKYVVKVTATNTTVGTINAFRVSMPAGKGVMSFYDQSSRQFAIQDRANWGPSPGNETRFDLPFAPSCTFNSSGEVSLLWRDDDQGQSNQGPNMRMRLLEDGVDITGQQPVPVFKGANADGSWKVTVKPGKKYIWRWEGVSERNGIQFQLPFDSFYYTFDCHPVTPVVDVSAVCSEGKLKFRVSDPTNTHYDARLRWDGQNINGSGSDSLLQDLTPGNSPGIHVYEFDVSDYADFGTHTVGVRIKSGNDPAFNYDSPTKIGPCATISCTSTSFEPNTPTPGEPFHMTSAISTTIGPKGDPAIYSVQPAFNSAAKITYEEAGPGIANTPSPTSTSSGTSPTSGPTSTGSVGRRAEDGYNGTAYAKWQIENVTTAGTYGGLITFKILPSGPSKTCGSPLTISDKPYLRVWGGDVTVGCDSSDIWKTGSDTGKILTFSRGTGRGAGTSMTVQALRDVDGFSSRQLSGSPDDYLTFANAGSGVDATWGGNFGPSPGQCASDLYGNAPTTKTSFSGTIPAASVTKSYSSGGSLSSSSRTIANGQSVTIYVDGDVTITGSGLVYSTAGWTDVSSIPSFKLIVSGDIMINRSVTQLSGTYVAQPRADGSGGTIYTCTNGSGKYDGPGLMSYCRNTLTVYGSFIAKDVKFLRLAGSISTANAGDAYTASSAAEKFVYGPEAWLKTTNLSPQVGTYDSITSMPPVF